MAFNPPLDLICVVLEAVEVTMQPGQHAHKINRGIINKTDHIPQHVPLISLQQHGSLSDGELISQSQ